MKSCPLIAFIPKHGNFAKVIIKIGARRLNNNNGTKHVDVPLMKIPPNANIYGLLICLNGIGQDAKWLELYHYRTPNDSKTDYNKLEVKGESVYKSLQTSHR